MNKLIRWNPQKARQLRADLTRGGISFEECVIAIEGSKILDIIENANPDYPNQKVYVLNLDGYAYCVPFVENKDDIFLKTMFPSRKYTAIYLSRKKP